VGIEKETPRFPLRLRIGLYARSVQADGASGQGEIAAAKAIAANPEASNAVIAEKIGVGHMTVSRARKQVDQIGGPEKRIGKDGKSYPAAPVYSSEDADEEDGVTVDMIETANAANRRRVFMRCAADTIRKAEQGAVRS
jgi:hypothetical protein